MNGAEYAKEKIKKTIFWTFYNDDNNNNNNNMLKSADENPHHKNNVALVVFSPGLLQSTVLPQTQLSMITVIT